MLLVQANATALLSKLQTTSKQFDPWVYLSTVHADTPGDKLQQGLKVLETSLNARKDQLRQLVKENFQRFIGCKGTIDDISRKLRVGVHADLHRLGASWAQIKVLGSAGERVCVKPDR
jgi:hypothetical protein